MRQFQVVTDYALSTLANFLNLELVLVLFTVFYDYAVRVKFCYSPDVLFSALTLFHPTSGL